MMGKSWRPVVGRTALWLFMGLGVSACSQDELSRPKAVAREVTPAPVGPVAPLAEAADEMTLELKLQPKKNLRLATSRAVLLEALSEGKPFSFKALTDLWIESHKASYLKAHRITNGTRQGQVTERLNEAMKAADSPGAVSDRHGFKVGYEERIEAKLGKPIEYNRGATTVLDMLLHGRTQSYSGTVLNQILLRRSQAGGRYREARNVVVFEAGHVLPGYFLYKSGEWHLYGVETTTYGRSVVYFGPAPRIRAAVRVVDAEMFAALEIFKAELANPSVAAAEAVRRTAERYGIDLDESERQIQRLGASSAWAARLSRSLLNASPFAFGAVSAPAGNRARATGENSNRSNVDFVGPDEQVAARPEPVGPVAASGGAPLAALPVGTVIPAGASAYTLTGTASRNESAYSLSPQQTDLYASFGPGLGYMGHVFPQYSGFVASQMSGRQCNVEARVFVSEQGNAPSAYIHLMLGFRFAAPVRFGGAEFRSLSGGRIDGTLRFCLAVAEGCAHGFALALGGSRCSISQF